MPRRKIFRLRPSTSSKKSVVTGRGCRASGVPPDYALRFRIMRFAVVAIALVGCAPPQASIAHRAHSGCHHAAECIALVDDARSALASCSEDCDSARSDLKNAERALMSYRAAGEPKSDDDRRLQEMRAEIEKGRKILTGCAIDESGLVVCSDDNVPLTPSQMSGRPPVVAAPTPTVKTPGF